MDNQKIEFIGTIVLPEFTGDISYEVAFSRAGITASKLFKTMFFEGRIAQLPSKEVDCYRAVSRINNLDLEKILGDSFQSLDPADIWRLFSLNNSQSEIKFKNNGACNMVLVSNGSKKVWRSQVFNSRHAGWKAELYTEPRLFYDELIFSGHSEK